MKTATYEQDAKTELLMLKKEIEVLEGKMSFTCEPKLIDALAYELLGLRARMGYVIDRAKQL